MGLDIQIHSSSTLEGALTCSMKDVLIGGIKATIIGEDRCTPNQEVILAVIAHGRTRSKDDTTKFAHLLLKSVPSLVCVVWDLPNHGARLIDESANDSWTEGNVFHLVQMQAIIDQGASEAASILLYAPVHLPSLKVVSRVMIGTSLGGYVTWRVASDYTSLLTAAVPIISSPNVLTVMTRRWQQYKESNGDKVTAYIEQLAFPEEVSQTMKEDAKRAIALQQSPVSILAICGGADPLVPPDCTVEWGKHASTHHHVEVVPGIKHEVPREMIDLTSEYLISLMTRVDL